MQVPPTCSRSMMAVFLPALAKAVESGPPDWPAPMTITSKVSTVSAIGYAPCSAMELWARAEMRIGFVIAAVCHAAGESVSPGVRWLQGRQRQRLTAEDARAYAEGREERVFNTEGTEVDGRLTEGIGDRSLDSGRPRTIGDADPIFLLLCLPSASSAYSVVNLPPRSSGRCGGRGRRRRCRGRCGARRRRR